MRGAKDPSLGSDASDIPMREPFKWNAVAGPPMSDYHALHGPAHANSVSFSCQSRGPGVLIVSALHLPGWRATVNGKPARIHRAYGMLRAVRVPGGRSVVKMSTPRVRLIPS